MTESEPDLPIEVEDAVADAVFQFNRNPKNGIARLCEVFNVTQTPKHIAELMHNVPGLLGDKIGEYLSKRGNEFILQYYFDKFDLRCPFLDAMRTALSGAMHLPGEGELIDRVVEAFATIYTSQNPGVFASISSAHILAYALILLNSDLHNPGVPRRMTQEEFISHLRPSILEKEISDEQLRVIYTDIKQNPFTFNSSSADQFFALSAPRLRGFLKKKSDRWNSFWTLHFFVLTNSCLYYFQDDSSNSKDTPLGMIELLGVHVSMNPRKPTRIIIKSDDSRDLQFVKFRSMPILIQGVSEMLLEAPNEKSAQKWFYLLQKSVVASSFHAAPADATRALSSTSAVTDLSENLLNDT